MLSLSPVLHDQESMCRTSSWFSQIPRLYNGLFIIRFGWRGACCTASNETVCIIAPSQYTNCHASMTDTPSPEHLCHRGLLRAQDRCRGIFSSPHDAGISPRPRRIVIHADAIMRAFRFLASASILAIAGLTATSAAPTMSETRSNYPGIPMPTESYGSRDEIYLDTSTIWPSESARMDTRLYVVC